MKRYRVTYALDNDPIQRDVVVDADNQERAQEQVRLRLGVSRERWYSKDNKKCVAQDASAELSAPPLALTLEPPPADHPPNTAPLEVQAEVTKIVTETMLHPDENLDSRCFICTEYPEPGQRIMRLKTFEVKSDWVSERPGYSQTWLKLEGTMRSWAHDFCLGARKAPCPECNGNGYIITGGSVQAGLKTQVCKACKK